MNADQLKQSILAKISSGESSSYNELFGGGSFDDYSDHPRERVPLGNNTYTDAAGKYQFLSSTWDDEKQRLGLSDFSPQSQDSAAWDLANRTYKSTTGRDLLNDAANSDVDWQSLSGQWPSLAKNSPQSGSGNSSMDSDSTPTNQLPVQSSSDDGDSGEPQMKNLAMLQSLAPHLQFTPVDYDPFKVEQGATQ